MHRGTVLITGCSSGIGLDAARTLQARGWQVLASCRQAADVQRLQDEGLTSFVLDLADEQSTAAGAERAIGQAGEGTLALYNNGAFGIPGCTEDLPRGALRSIFETNLFGQFQLIHQMLPAMKARGAGRIVNCSSVLGFAALRFRGAYTATKFAMEGLTDTLRLENRHWPQLHVSLIEPGPIGTRIRVNSQPHFERWIDVEASDHRTLYETVLMPRLYSTDGKKDRFELPPAAVSAKLVHALESDRPRARYYVTTPTWISGMLKRVLTTTAFDRFAARY